MAQRFTGQAQLTIDAPINAVWQEAVGLEWLRDWDGVEFAGPPGLHSTFTLHDELRTFPGRFTTFEAPMGGGSTASLAWQVDDGGAGVLRLRSAGAQTRATWAGTSVPHGLDQLFSLTISLIPGRAKRLSDEECAKDLRVLARLAGLRATGRRIVERGIMARQMAAECQFGGPSADPDSLPELDGAGDVRFEPEERVLATSSAIVVTTAAKAASGREKFQVLWRSHDAGADVVLTDRRLIYRNRGAAPPAGAVERTEAIAGHLRHGNVANVILGDGSDYGLARLRRITATLFEPPQTGIRVHLLLDNPDDLAAAWARAVASWRMAAYPDLEQSSAERWETLRSQAEAPRFDDGFWGPMAKLPLFCALGSKTPMP